MAAFWFTCEPMRCVITVNGEIVNLLPTAVVFRFFLFEKMGKAVADLM